MKRIYQIGIIGSAGNEEYPDRKPNQKIYKYAYELGSLIAKQGFILVTGGKGGIMEEASRGAKEENGVTVGIVKGSNRNVANKYVDVEIISNTASGGEENILVLSCDALVAIGGGAGTLQELAFAYRCGRPIIALTGVGGFSSKFAGQFLDERETIKITKTKDPKSAINLLKKLLK